MLLDERKKSLSMVDERGKNDCADETRMLIFRSDTGIPCAVLDNEQSNEAGI